jgi:hypothetical protein
MATTRKTAGWKSAAKTPTGATKAKVKRVARKAKQSLDVAAHDAELALGRTTRKLKGKTREIGTKLERAKAPAERRARRVESKVVAALQDAGDLIKGAVRKAKSRIAAATK